VLRQNESERESARERERPGERETRRERDQERERPGERETRRVREYEIQRGRKSESEKGQVGGGGGERAKERESQREGKKRVLQISDILRNAPLRNYNYYLALTPFLI
jgi:hypothetical protein